MAKYLFMYVSGGAGHVGRSLTIANYLRDMDPNSEIVFAGGKVGKRMVEENGFRFMELETPEYFQDNRPTSDVKYLACTYIRNLGRYRRAILSANPDIVVVDTEPLFVFLSKFLGFRTVFINHELIPLWVEDISPISRHIRDRVLRCANERADAIIFPDIMGIEPDASIKDKTHVVGPLGYTRFERVELKGDRRILVVPSATGDVPDEVLKALEKGKYQVYVRSSGDDSGNIHFLPRARNLMSYMDAVDVVLCSGYSTIMEAVALGKPVVIYPTTEEQRIVGRLCEKSGIALYSERPEGVFEAVERMFSDESLREGMVRRQRRYGNGAMQAAKVLMGLSRSSSP